MYHIVPEIGFSNYIVVHWDCHSVVRLVLSNGHIYYFHDREVGFTRRFSILRLPQCRGWLHPTVIYYFHGREVGFTRRFGILGFTTVT